jgi:hypothetical protein
MTMKRIGIGSVVLLGVAVVSATATVHVAGGRSTGAVTSAPAPRKATRTPAGPRYPSAAEFGRALVGTTNQFAAATGDPTRIGHPHCVPGSRGNYMCAYSSKRPGTPRECHLMQGRWTPKKDSTITVTLGGRTGRCGSIREAIASLQ